MTGVVYYGPATGWYVDLTFTGLDPAAQYTFATSASRANPAYTDRYSIYTISDVDAATNSSTAGTQEYLGDPMAVWFNTGDNHGDGYVARWTTIQPGANGSFTVRAEAHPSANSGYKAYAFDVFMLEEEGGTPPVQYDLTVNTDGSGTVDLVPPGGIYDEGTSVELTAVPNGGWIFDSWAGDLSGSANPETITMDGNKTVTATFVTEPIAENWTAYVDLRSEAGDSNQTNVLAIIPTGPDIQPIDPAVDWVLKDFATGANLPITMTVDMDIRYPTTNGADSDPGTDAALLFGGIVDGVGGYEIEDISSDYVTLNFGNLNPDKEYILAVTNNRANIDYDNRATNFTITGADTFVNASSSGVFVYGEDSISFSTGNNTANGYVAQWTGITAADGSFSINAVQDTSQPGWDGSKAYAMTSIMLQEYDPPAELVCETFDAFTVGANVGSHADWFDGDGGPIVNAAGGVALSQGLDPAGSIFTWMAQPFFWDDSATTGYKASMDFQTSATGQFDDDRIGWMIDPNSTDSDLIFGVQLDNADSHLRMEGYWDHIINVNENIRVELANLDGVGLVGDTWYRLAAEFTKLTDSSAQIDAELWLLDGSGNPISLVASGAIADTSAILPDTDRPDVNYFVGELWPAYKNYSSAAGSADNACYAVVTGAPPVQYDLTVNLDGGGTVDLVPPGGLYNEGTSVELTAVPNGGWIFDSWSGDLSGSTNPETLTMDANKTVTATFVTEPVAEN